MRVFEWECVKRNLNERIDNMEKQMRQEIDDAIAEHVEDGIAYAVFSCGGYGKWKSHFIIGKTECGCGGILEFKVYGEEAAREKALGVFIKMLVGDEE